MIQKIQLIVHCLTDNKTEFILTTKLEIEINNLKFRIILKFRTYFYLYD